MDIRILDTNFNLLSILDTYKSIIWTERYNKCGDFELLTSASFDIINAIKQDYYLQITDSDYVMIVEKIRIETDAEDGNRVTFSGRSLESILDRRIIWGQKSISGSLQNGIETLLNECIISPSDDTRKISNFIFNSSTDPAITALTIDAQWTGDNLYDVVYNLCNEVNVGFKILLNDNNQFVFSLYYGKDRSYNQTTNPYVVFSPQFDNIMNSNYVESKSALKNITLVAGEGEGIDRVYTAVGTDDSGLYRRELYTDARDLQSEISEDETLSPEEYITILQNRGKEKLTEHASVVSFEGEVDPTAMYKYGIDFFNGDIVQIANEYGHEITARILEVVMSEDEQGISIYPTFTMI